MGVVDLASDEDRAIVFGMEAVTVVHIVHINESSALHRSRVALGERVQWCVHSGPLEQSEGLQPRMPSSRARVCGHHRSQHLLPREYHCIHLGWFSVVYTVVHHGCRSPSYCDHFVFHFERAYYAETVLHEPSCAQDKFHDINWLMPLCDTRRN